MTSRLRSGRFTSLGRASRAVREPLPLKAREPRVFRNLTIAASHHARDIWPRRGQIRLRHAETSLRRSVGGPTAKVGGRQWRSTLGVNPIPHGKEFKI
ncbi:hypothetical protein CDL15_Pgr024418 [Punica granatum]|uniref:Uncharacterized protein n=1 Tax=Punica granatum TaxID=22663 RepID=A0A218XXV6_PUNGR|nr:hypothetical protein CDL15_Pgr024418 [Punica granatum]